MPSLYLSEYAEGYATRADHGGFFGSERIYNSSRSLSGGMGAGDIDGDGETEVVFCDFSGNVVMMDPRPDGSFRPLPIWEQEGPQGTGKGLFDLVVSDVLDTYPGPEMVVAGYTGNVHVIYRDGETYDDTIIYTMPVDEFGEPFRVFEIEIADMDPAPGEEILLGSMVNNQFNPDRYLRYLTRSGTGWTVNEVELPNSVKAIDVGDADPAVPGVEVYVTTSGWNELGGTESSLLEVFPNGTGWSYKSIFKNNENLIANVRVGEIWSGHEGNELITAGLSGWCRMFWEDGGTFDRSDIFQAQTSAGESSALEGLTIGDFNPLHDGDEAMVTGYYNEVTQIIEIDGDVIGDLAWKTLATDVKLEISGVEVADVSDDHSGNEVMIASLQGWIEMLFYQEDGLELELPEEEIEVETGSSGQFEFTIIPSGSLSGEALIDITGAVGATLVYDTFVQVDFGVPETVTVVITPEEETEAEFDLNISVTVSGLQASGTVPVHVVPSGGFFTIVVEPSTLTLYDAAGNNGAAVISLEGAQGYDLIDLSVNEVTGLNAMVDSPIAPEGSSNLYVNVQPGFIGSRTLTITGSHSGIPVSQAALTVNVVELSEVLDFRLMETEGNHYVMAYLNASAPVRNLTYTVLLGDEVIYTQDLSMDGDSRKDLPLLPLNEGDEGTITVRITNVAGTLVEEEDLGMVDIQEEDEGTEGTEWLIGGLVIIAAIIIVLVLFLFNRPKEGATQDASIEGIGGRRKFDYRTRDSPVRRGPLGEREPRGRRVPPPPRDRPPRGRRL